MKKLFVASLMVFLLTAGVFADEQKPITGGKVGLSFFTSEKILDLFMTEGALKSSFVEYSGVSLIWHVTDSIALEPSLFLSFWDSTYKSNSGTETTDDYFTGGGALGIYYYSNLSGGAYMYIGPRGDYLRMEETDNDPTGSYDTTKTNGFGISLVLGLKYMFNPHVGIFGDISAGYYITQRDYDSYNTSGTPISHTERESKSFILSKGLVGVSLYF